MEKTLQNDIIIFTLLQEIKKESKDNEFVEIRIFCQSLLDRVDFELENWDSDSN